MKIRFTIEIKGCQWWEDKGCEKTLKNCPFIILNMMSNPICTANGKSRELPDSLNPAWCPKMKQAVSP